jgi:hypothetical protein
MGDKNKMKKNLQNILSATIVAAGVSGCVNPGKYEINSATTNSDLAGLYTSQIGTMVNEINDGCFREGILDKAKSLYSESYETPTDYVTKRFDNESGLIPEDKLPEFNNYLIDCGYEQRQINKDLVWVHTTGDAAKWYTIGKGIDNAFGSKDTVTITVDGTPIDGRFGQGAGTRINIKALGGN